MYENPVECFEDKLFMVTGICYGFQAMRFLESPNTPFTIIYERFPEGIQFTNVNAKGREEMLVNLYTIRHLLRSIITHVLFRCITFQN